MIEDRPTGDPGRIPKPMGGVHAELAHLHKLRLAAVRAGTWPEHSLRMWREIAARATARPDGVSPAPLEQMALEVVAAAGSRR